ncbi:unnamed protein product [Notodromas monacha]|uniref:Beta-sarcoglycan n=1 Tax=Notodromas monacha TaxID=399045 RepID=A0A7R9BYI2_9CRUS|nr:unnamed protein product [Notodromas monacha]CAG0924092.1 unnamed protein product [Notodromas monacha]
MAPGSYERSVSPGSATTVSIRHKSSLNRKSAHESGDWDEQVPIVGSYPSKPGPCGRRAYLFWIVVVLLLLLALGNLATTVFIFGVLRLSNGMKNMEFVVLNDADGGERRVIRFHGDVDLGNVVKQDGLIEAFGDESISLETQDGSIGFKLQARPEELIINSLYTQVVNVDSFLVRDPATGAEIFSTAYPNFGLPKGVTQIAVEQATTSRVVSPMDASLTLKSHSQSRLKGNEGLHMDSAQAQWYAHKDIFLKSVQGGITLAGKDGVRIYMKDVPVVKGDDALGHGMGQFQICACAKTGMLFRVPIPKDNARRLDKVHCGYAELPQGFCG